MLYTNLLSLATALYTIVYHKSKQTRIAKNYEFKKGVGIESTKKVQKQGLFLYSLVYKSLIATFGSLYNCC